ncbi:HD domain-containing protein [Longimicrobium sp.]|uniref:HD domain-containing protein n=1 Tax=Longimicrobium sp. TaxID=2029185 RepID=UPI002C9BB033|nr:HD domain-containing protein [Longimicrobium sp.]HSU15607.1 HD domain-containing protein [Longimicrobium sp.]
MRDQSPLPNADERGADPSAAALLRFFHLAGRLKDTPRAGWALRGISAPESVAEHSFRTALLALVLAPRAAPPLDVPRCVAMAVVHDLAESLVGDITPYDNVPADEKRRREEAAMLRLAALAGDDSLAALWREYDAAESPEARFVKELDKLETAFQAAEYEQRGDAPPGALDEFRANADARLTSPVPRALLDALRRESAEVRECGSALDRRAPAPGGGDGG